MAKNNASPETQVITPEPETTALTAFHPAQDIQPVKLGAILQEYGLNGPQVPAEQLKDREFIIMGAKPFKSAYKEQAHAYFCVCKDTQTGEVFSTVLGGQVVVETIDALVRANLQSPILVTLRYMEGKGAFAGYYVLE